MPKMVCVQCQRELTPLKNGVIVVEMMGPNSHPRPYKIWEADLWKCAKCDTRVVAGFAERPLAEHFEEGFAGAFQTFLHIRGTWVIFDYENEEQREAGAALGYKNSYGGEPVLTAEQLERLDRLLSR